MTAALFLACLALTAGALVLGTRRWASGPSALAIQLGLPIWLAYVGVLSWSGVVGDAGLRPPGIVYVVAPAVLFVGLFAVRSRSGGTIARTAPLVLLIGFQVYRVGVELFLHQLWREGLAPRMLTFEGANLDIVIGLTAPLAAWLATRGRGGLLAALIWNGLGLVSLVNVVARSALTSPGPLNLIHAEVANHAIGTFPYTFIAGFFAPLSVTLHVLALRAIAARRAPVTIPKGLPA